jgi:pimeloyl-ACP methyl ester carboxylesterase
MSAASRAPITAQDGWDSYTADHIALLDHLRIDRCHLHGQCIGGSFILNLIKQQPERVRSRAGAADRPRRTDGARPPRPLQRLGGTLATTRRPPACWTRSATTSSPRFVYCVDRAFVSKVRTLSGARRQRRSPPTRFRESKLLPNCEFVAEWKTGAALTSAKARAKEFLAKHTPARA